MYTALASTSLVSAVTVPDGSSPVILPSVCSAINRLISARAASGAAAKSASASVTPGVPTRAWNRAPSRSPDWIHTVAGARNIADPPPGSPPPGRAGISLRPVAATFCGSGYLLRCSTRASSAAVWPLAPHSAIRNALATLAGEKTMSSASAPSTPYRSTPSAASASAASRARAGRRSAFGPSPGAAGSSRTVPTYPPKVKPWPGELVHDGGHKRIPGHGGGLPARRPGQEHGDADRDRGPQGHRRLGRDPIRLVAAGRRAGRGRVHAHAGLSRHALHGKRPRR